MMVSILKVPKIRCFEDCFQVVGAAVARAVLLLLLF